MMHLRINEQIKAPEVRVIGPDGKQCGILATAEALRLAQGLRMDLVEVAPNAVPPVVRIVDFASVQEEFKRRQPSPDCSNN
jgi:translation initiation factor IF-3